MEYDKKYPIILITKVPYVSELLLSVVSVCFIIVGLAFLFLLPSLSSSNEMKSVASVTIIPEKLKWVILFSGIGLLLFRLLYKLIVIRKPGFFNFNSDSFTISTSKFIYQIPHFNIGKIEVIDATDRHNNSREIFKVIIYQYNQDNLQFRLKAYSDSYEFVDSLVLHENLLTRIKDLNKVFLSESSI